MDSVDTQPWQPHIAAIQAGTDTGAVDQAVRALKPLIEEQAEAICQRRRTKQTARFNFVSSAAAFVLTLPRKSLKDGKFRPPIVTYDPAKGPFPNWLAVVLQNRLVDQWRRARRRAKHEVSLNTGGEESDASQTFVDPIQEDPGAAIDWNAPFSDHEHEQIGGWPVEDRLLVLATLNLWKKIHPAIWSNWCSEKELPIPFPPEPHFRERIQWVELFADKFPASRHALHNRIRRRLEKRQKEPLEFIRGVQYEN